MSNLCGAIGFSKKNFSLGFENLLFAISLRGFFFAAFAVKKINTFENSIRPEVKSRLSLRLGFQIAFVLPYRQPIGHESSFCQQMSLEAILFPFLESLLVPPLFVDPFWYVRNKIQ
jgi:hypothetical protein